MAKRSIYWSNLLSSLFLPGLAEGLGRAVISGIDNRDADYFVLSDSAESLITVSNLDTDVYEQLAAQADVELAILDIQRMYLYERDDAEKLNITYFAIEAGSFLEPAVAEGVQLADSNAENLILLDDDFALVLNLADRIYHLENGRLIK